jgi:hypothetical protein
MGLSDGIMEGSMAAVYVMVTGVLLQQNPSDGRNYG